jgi:hypothetical protein
MIPAPGGSVTSDLNAALDAAVAFHQELLLGCVRLDPALSAAPDRLSAPWAHFVRGIREHLDIEERVLFPAIRALTVGQDPEGDAFLGPLRAMQHEADELETISGALRNAARDPTCSRSSTSSTATRTPRPRSCFRPRPLCTSDGAARRSPRRRRRRPTRRRSRSPKAWPDTCSASYAASARADLSAGMADNRCPHPMAGRGRLRYRPSMTPAFHPIVAAWFTAKFGTPTEPQEQGWPAIAAGKDTLIAAPTGSGKTLAAFLWCLDRLVRQAVDGTLVHETQVIYVSPLKALGNDVQKNLEAPLAEIRALAEAQGTPLPAIRTAVRTGDTPARDRKRLQDQPPHVLTPRPSRCT